MFTSQINDYELVFPSSPCLPLASTDFKFACTCNSIPYMIGYDESAGNVLALIGLSFMKNEQ